MASTKDQRDIRAILAQAKDARDSAYSLFSRRLDTRRNVESFILLRDAFNKLKDACDDLAAAEQKAIESRSSDQNFVIEEIMVRSGKMVIHQDDDHQPLTEAIVLTFPVKEKNPQGPQD